MCWAASWWASRWPRVVRVAFGSPGGRPSVTEVASVLTDMGYDVKSINHADERVARASVMDVELGSG